VLELGDILGRAKFARKLAATQLSIDQLVERYALLATAVRPAAISPTILEDPDDDHVLAGALAAKAELIVSGDRHLLDLKQFRDIPVVTAAGALARIREQAP
jgi:uncharacterized protein